MKTGFWLLSLLVASLACPASSARDLELSGGSKFVETILIWPSTERAPHADVARTVWPLLSEKFKATYGGKGWTLLVITTSKEASDFGVFASAIVGLTPSAKAGNQPPAYPLGTFRASAVAKQFFGEKALAESEIAVLRFSVQMLMDQCEKDARCDVLHGPP